MVPLPAAGLPQEQQDPLTEEMTLKAIQSRLKIAKEKASINPEEGNSAMGKRQAQWQRVTELLEMQVTRLESEQQALTPEPIDLPPYSPPFSISYLDHVRQKYHSFNESYALIEQEIKAVQHRITVDQTAYTNTARALHLLEDEGATVEEKLNANLAFQVAKEVYIAARLDARLSNNKLKLARRNIDHWSKWLPKVESQVVFSMDDYDNYLNKITDREKSLKKALIFIQQAIKKEHHKTKEQQIYVKRLEALRDLLNESIAYLPKERTIWEERKTLYLSKIGVQKIIDRKKQALLEQEELNKLVQVKELRTEGQKGLASANELLNEKARKKEIALEKTILFNQDLAFKSLRSLSQLLNTYLADLETIQNTRQIFYFKERVANIFDALWSFEIAVVQDQMITVKKVFMAIVFFTVAIYLTRLIFLKLLCNMLLKMHVSEGVAFMVSHLLYYLLLFILLFVAISSAGIPLAVFALFGGALAIAAGIGSQKILNNFLSGIILLIERSIQVGDMIEVDKTQGVVKRIGLRNVHIKTFSNVDMLVPNSKLLEENVINWTLESDIIKAYISVKVDFDVDFNKVINLLTKIAINHPKILSEKRPKAFLEEFNSDNGYLLFKLYYWLRVPNPEEKLSIESDLRIGILSCLCEHGIALASPSLDVTLSTEQAAIDC
ncbi:MAG: mechanosensitive ion channel [Methyloprofundus sp.]|nr:mechanosensitive ion channel [Methyloprofundus sp.]